MEATIRQSGEMYLINAHWLGLGDCGIALDDSDLEKFFGPTDAKKVRACRKWPLKLQVKFAVDEIQ